MSLSFSVNMNDKRPTCKSSNIQQQKWKKETHIRRYIYFWIRWKRCWWWVAHVTTEFLRQFPVSMYRPRYNSVRPESKWQLLRLMSFEKCLLLLFFYDRMDSEMCVRSVFDIGRRLNKSQFFFIKRYKEKEKGETETTNKERERVLGCVCQMSVKKDEPIRSLDGYATNLLTVFLICVFIYIYTIESVERKKKKYTRQQWCVKLCHSKVNDGKRITKPAKRRKTNSRERERQTSVVSVAALGRIYSSLFLSIPFALFLSVACPVLPYILLYFPTLSARNRQGDRRRRSVDPQPFTGAAACFHVPCDFVNNRSTTRQLSEKMIEEHRNDRVVRPPTWTLN